MMELPNKFFADEDAKKFCCEQSSSADQSDIRVDRSWWGLHTSWMMLQRTVHCTVHMVYDVTRCTVHTSWMMLQKASLQRTVHTACNVTVHNALCHSAHCTMLQCQSAQHTIAQDSTQYNTQDSVLCSVEDSAQYSTHSTTQYYTVLHSAQCSTQCTVYTHSAQCRVWHNSENCTFAARTCQALIATCSDHVIKETNKIFEQCQ